MKLMSTIVLLAVTMSSAHGARVRVSEIVVSGNHRTDAGVIRNYLYLREGDVMSPEELDTRIARSRRRLLDTRYFSNARITATYLSGGDVRICVSIVEGFLWRLTAGTWYVQAGRDNLFGKGINGSLYISTKSQALTFDDPYFRGSPFLIRMQAIHLQAGRDIVYISPEEDFDYRKIGVAGSVGYNFNPDLSVALIAGVYEFKLEEGEFGPDAERFLEDNGVSGRTKDTDIGASVRLDRRNNRLTPTDGYSVQSALLFRDGAPGMTVNLLNYQELGSRAYFFSRLSLTSFGDDLPYHLWQGLGGITGLKFPGSEDLLGRSTVIISIEPRYRFMEIRKFNAFLEARLFFDTGTAVIHTGDITADRFVSGFGAGLRLWIGYPYFQNAVAYYGSRRGEGKFFFRFGSSF